jgi:signal transduction histidine kinase/tetratricopeptide (TPR) repeat protein
MAKMTSLKYILLLFFLICATKANAQVKTPQQKLDSILAVDRLHPKEDSMKLVIYKAIYRQYIRMKNEPKIEEYMSKSITLARKLNLRNFEGDAHHFRARSFYSVANFQKAIEYYQKAITVYTAINNLDMAAGMYQNLGALYERIPDYAKALASSLEAMAVYQKNGNVVDLAGVYTNISGIYIDLGQQANAFNYLQKALKIFLVDDERGVAVVYNSIAFTYLEASEADLLKMGTKPIDRYVMGLENLNKALKVAQKIADVGVFKSVYSGLGKVYEQTNKRDLALQAYMKSLAYARENDITTDLAEVLLWIANFYTQERAFDKALTYLNEALKIGEKNQALDVLKNSYQLLSSIEEMQGNYTASLASYKKYITVRDEIFNEEKEKEITRKQLQIDFAVKEKDYQLKQQLTDVELQRQFLLAKEQQQQLALRKQQLILSDQQQSLQRLMFLKKQAELEREKLFQANLLNQEQLKAQLDKQIRDKQIFLQQAELRFNRNITLFMSILAFILFSASIVVYYAKRKTSKLNKVVLQQKQELEKLGMVKDRIFSVVSHDMRTPVNSLISFIQLLEGGNINPDKLTKYAANLKNTLGYTSSMMENLLNWASSQMQGFKPLQEKFDIKICAQEVINSMEAVAIQKRIKINNEIKSGILCLADMNMTSLVLRNLISNAVKFTPNEGAVDVSVEVNDTHILVQVKDNGIGLSAAQLLAFNQPGFEETGKSTPGTNNEKGTGIGLVLCKTFTQMMHGSLQAVSEAGKYTIFILSLPKQ